MSPDREDRPNALRPPLPRNVKLLGWASFLNDVASEMVVPLLPQFLISVLGGDKFLLGAIEGLADSVSSLVKLGSGGWSDRVRSRKGFVVFGYALASISRPIIGLLVAPWQLLAARCADRIGKGVRTSPRDAMIADATEPPERGRAFGFHRAMDHLGAAIGPLLAAAVLWLLTRGAGAAASGSAQISPANLRLLFLLTLVPGAMVVLLLGLGLHDQRAETKAGGEFVWTLAPFGSSFRLYLVALAIFTLGNASDAFLLVRAGELGVPTVVLPILWSVFHVAKSAGNYLAGGRVQRFGPRRMILAGWIFYAAVYIAFAVATAAWQVWLLFLAYAAFYAVTEPAEKTLVASLAGPERRGLAYGWFNFAVGVATLPASVIFGWLYQAFGPLAAFGWGAGAALLAVGLLSVVKMR